MEQSGRLPRRQMYNNTEPVSSIIKDKMVALPIWSPSCHNLNVTFGRAGSHSRLGGGAPHIRDIEHRAIVHMSHDNATYQEIVDDNNVDRSMLSPGDVEAFEPQEYSLPRTIQPRQFDNLVLVTVGMFHIVVDVKASGIIIEATCFATPDVMDMCPETSFPLLPIDKKQKVYVMDASCVLDSNEFVLCVSKCQVITMVQAGGSSQPYLQGPESLVQEDVQEDVQETRQAVNESNCEVLHTSKAMTITLLPSNSDSLQPYRYLVEQVQDDLVQSTPHNKVRLSESLPATTTHIGQLWDCGESMSEPSVQNTTQNGNPVVSTGHVDKGCYHQFKYNCEGISDPLVQTMTVKNIPVTSIVDVDVKSHDQCYFNEGTLESLTTEETSETVHGGTQEASSSRIRHKQRTGRLRIGEKTLHKKKHRDLSGDEKSETKKALVSRSGKDKAETKKRTDRKFVQATCTCISPSGHRTVNAQKECVKVALRERLEQNPHKLLTPPREVVLTTAHQETQYRTPSSLEFSKAFSWMRLLEAFTQNGRKPVICLLKKDLVCAEHFSPERRVRSHIAARSVSVAGASTTEGNEVEDQTRGEAAIRISCIPKLNAEVTQLLHASDYPKVIESLGDIDNQLPESQIPALFVAGVAYFKMSKFDEAKEHFSKCESLALSENRDGDIMLCNAYLGDIEYASRSYLKATKHYRRSIKYYSPGSIASLFRLTPPTLSAIYAKRASSFRNESKMIEAVQDYRTAIDVAQTDRDRLSAHTSLGNLYQSMGDNSSALTEYKQSIELATGLSDHVSLGWAHGNIGNAYLGLNKKDEAVFHLQKSLDLAVEYEQTPQAIGRTYNNLGTAYQSMNDLDKAEEYYDLALSQAIYGNDIPGQARVYGNIGNVHMLRKNYERAIPHYGEVLRLSTDEATISTAQHNRGCAYYEFATSLCGKESSQLSFHGPECDPSSCVNLPYKAKELYSKGANDLQEVVKYHEKRLNDIKGSKNGLTLSVSLIESNSRTFHRLQDCLVNLHRWEEALVVAEKSRARTLGELMLRRNGCHLRQPLISPLTFDQIANIVQTQNSPVIYLSYTGARLIGWVFVLYSGKVAMNMFAVPLSDDQFEGKSFDYHLRYSLTEKLVEHSFEMYQPVIYDERSSSTVQVLYDLVAMPMTTFLCQHESTCASQQVVCISDSYTSLLPLTCLLDKEKGSFFGDQYYFKLAPSLLSLGIMNQLPEVTVTLPIDQHQFCVIGDPNIPPFYLNGELWTLGKLPHARKEARWVAHALGTTPILNEHASKTALLNRVMNAKVIHIATHGSASAGFLAFATFSTAAKSGSFHVVTAENVLLYPQDVEKLSISPALVVLSSCDSGRGTVKADGIQGMARAFILAGAQSVLTTLWKVPDESASVFMQFFYQYLLDEMESSYALQKAILSVRCFAKYSQYIHWSGYQLTGRDILFSKCGSIASGILTKRLGSASIFPRLHDIQVLEKAFLKSPNLPTDVQILQGCPGMESSEVVIDFIMSSHPNFSAGIFWINCSQQSLFEASICCIEEIIGCDILKLSVSEVRQALFVFDGLDHLPDSEVLLRLLKNQNIHIIVLHEQYASTDKLVKEIDHKLIRGCAVLTVEPLTMIHSTQRIVHSFMKDYEFTPTNNDQMVFEKLAEFTSGSPTLVDIASQLVHSCFELNQGAIQHLTELLSLQNKIQATENYSTGQLYQATTRAVSSNMSGIIGDIKNYDTPQHDYSHDIWTTNTEYDSWDAVLALIAACKLSSEERLLLDSLSLFNCSPIPHSIIAELASMIANSCQKPHLAGTLHCNLFKYRLVCDYPHPVIYHDSVRDSSQGDQDSFKLVYIPHHISQCIWKNLEEVDQVVVINLVFHTLCTLYQTFSTKERSNLCLFIALCFLLLETCDSNFELIGKECYQQIYSLFLRFKSC